MFLNMEIVGFWYNFSVEVNEGKTVTTFKMGLKKFVKLISYGVFDAKDYISVIHVSVVECMCAVGIS